MTIPGQQDLEDTISRLVTSTLLKKSGNLKSDDELLSGKEDFDSFALMELVLRLEETFRINIPDEDLDPDIFHSVKTIVSYVQNRLGQGD